MIHAARQLIDQKGRGGTFSALALFPKKIHFEAQDPEEKIVLLLRPHIVTNLWWVLTALIMTSIPLMLPILPIFSNLPVNFLLVITMFWYAFILVFSFERFLLWFFSVNIVTDERVIDVDFYGLLFKQVSVAQLDKIEDTKYAQKGIFAAFFNYGDVQIQTAAEIPSFVFNKVPNPEAVTKILSELTAEEKQEELEGRVR